MLRTVLAAALLCAVVTPVCASEGLPYGVTCAMVRAKVAEHGLTAALTYAERNYRPEQVRAARRCVTSSPSRDVSARAQ